MKKIVMIFAAMAAVLSSCNKNEIEPVSKNDGKDIVLNISVSNPGADDTKALIKEGWEENDQIQIWFDTRVGTETPPLPGEQIAPIGQAIIGPSIGPSTSPVITPDLVIKYDGSKWTQEGTVKHVPNEGSGYVKAVYDNKVIVASKDNYSVSGNILTFDIENWTFLTEIQVVVYGDDIDGNNPSKYTLACDKFTPCTGYTVGSDGITASKGETGAAVTGISNDGVNSKPGVAFVFATADYSSSSTEKKDFAFTLKDNTSGSEVTKVYKPNVAIEAKSGKSSIKALTIASSKFAVPTKGTAKATIGGSEVDVNWVQLWAGGPKFAEYNVGAENNKAEDYGDYYAWNGDATVTNIWGSNWRMPTKDELNGLFSNCTAEWTQVNGVNGRKFTGNTDPYKSNSVFLPAAGYVNDGPSPTPEKKGIEGHYWSSSKPSTYAFRLKFDSGSQYVNYSGVGLFDKYSVRAVLAE